MRDVLGSLWGALASAAALLAPGFFIGWTTGLLGFRRHGLREQLAWSAALSFALGTLPLVGLVWLGGLTFAALVLAALTVLAVTLFIREGCWRNVSPRAVLPYAALACVWALVVVLSITDIGTSGKLWMSVTSFDHTLRVAFVDAVMRTGVPPANPAYWAGHDAPMRYYYFWYVVCAAVAKLTGISARQAFVASCVWPFFGLVAMLALYGRYLLEWRGPALQRRWWTAVALMSVTGLDALVVLALWLLGGGARVFGDMEWWSVDQVSSWLDTLLWAPHHAAALVCCLLCVLLLRLASVELEARKRMLLAVIAGVSFASSFVLSIYVAVATTIVLALWLLWRFLREDRVRALASSGIAGVTALLVLAPYLFQLLRPQPGAATSTGHVLGLGVRRILQPDVLFGFPWLHSLQLTHPRVATELSALLLLPLTYPVELGFFAVVLIATWKLRHGPPGERTLLFLTCAGWISASFLRSQVIATNDYGVRASLLPQFTMLLLGVLALEGSRRLLRGLLLLLVVIGVAGSVYQLILLRTYLGWHEQHHDPLMADLAEYNYTLHDVYAELRSKTPASARVQFSVNNDEYFRYAELLNVGRQVIVESDGCNTSFGGEKSPCARIQDAVHRLYPESGHPAPAAEEAAALCTGIGAKYLVAVRWDDVWDARSSWVWTLPIVVERPNARIVRCSLANHPS